MHSQMKAESKVEFWKGEGKVKREDGKGGSAPGPLSNVCSRHGAVDEIDVVLLGDGAAGGGARADDVGVDLCTGEQTAEGWKGA